MQICVNIRIDKYIEIINQKEKYIKILTIVINKVKYRKITEELKTETATS